MGDLGALRKQTPFRCVGAIFSALSRTQILNDSNYAEHLHRGDAKFILNVHGRWEDAAEDEAVITGAREFFEASNHLRQRVRTSIS